MGRNKDVLVGEGVVCAGELVREGDDAGDTDIGDGGRRIPSSGDYITN